MPSVLADVTRVAMCYMCAFLLVRGACSLLSSPLSSLHDCRSCFWQVSTERFLSCAVFYFVHTRLCLNIGMPSSFAFQSHVHVHVRALAALQAELFSVLQLACLSQRRSDDVNGETSGGLHCLRACTQRRIHLHQIHCRKQTYRGKK